MDAPEDPAPIDGRRPAVVTAVAESVEATLGGMFAVRLLATGASLGVWVDTAPGSAFAAAAAVIPACVLWRWRFPATFGRCCGYRVRAIILRIIHYGPRWPGVARAAGLVAYAPGTTAPVMPRLHRVVCSAEADELRVDQLPGRVLGDYLAALALLRATRHSPGAGVHVLPGGQVALRVLRHQRSSRTPSSTLNTHRSHIRVLCRHRRARRAATRSPRSLCSADNSNQSAKRFDDECNDPTEHTQPTAAAGTASLGVWERS